jgi:hypothetical protein
MSHRALIQDENDAMSSSKELGTAYKTKRPCNES